MNEIEGVIQVLCCHSRRVEIYWQDLYVVKVYAGSKMLCQREGPTVAEALLEATEMLVTHGEQKLTA